MTGGIAVILGGIGRNFAAGMSGGIAYIYNPDNAVDTNNFNMEMVELEELTLTDIKEIKTLIENHFNYTSSPLAKGILDKWENNTKKFIKVMPTEYKKALERLAKEKELELTTV